MSLSNSWNGSKLIMGDDIPKLIDFKKQFAEYVYMLAIYYSLKVVFININ